MRGTNTSLSNRIEDLNTSLNNRIEDLNTSLNNRMDRMARPGSGY